MFARLFAETGLSLDRLRALVEVGAAGSIAKAAEGDPIRQSQYSRQIKELEDFFQAKLVERHGKGIRLTAGGKELARISRFFLLGLSNFQRGCRAEEQTFRIGCSATFASCCLLPTLAESAASHPGPRYAIEIAEDPEIERRLHDLTLDFGVVTAATISRPLQLKELGEWRLKLWVPKALCWDEGQAWRAIKDQQLPLVLPSKEFALLGLADFLVPEPRLSCGSFLDAKRVLGDGQMAALLPSFLTPDSGGAPFWEVRLPVLEKAVFGFRFAWNPRLLRLNPHATRRRDALIAALAGGSPQK
jgi:DNA-binding transcriptional LysR family regulator